MSSVCMGCDILVCLRKLVFGGQVTGQSDRIEMSYLVPEPYRTWHVSISTTQGVCSCNFAGSRSCTSTAAQLR